MTYVLTPDPVSAALCVTFATIQGADRHDYNYDRMLARFVDNTDLYEAHIGLMVEITTKCSEKLLNSRDLSAEDIAMGTITRNIESPGYRFVESIHETYQQGLDESISYYARSLFNKPDKDEYALLQYLKEKILTEELFEKPERPVLTGDFFDNFLTLAKQSDRHISLHSFNPGANVLREPL